MSFFLVCVCAVKRYVLILRRAFGVSHTNSFIKLDLGNNVSLKRIYNLFTPQRLHVVISDPERINGIARCRNSPADRN